jgi:hypothetical protein
MKEQTMQAEAEQWLKGEANRKALEEIKRNRKEWLKRKERVYRERKREEDRERVQREEEIERLKAEAKRARGQNDAREPTAPQEGLVSIGASKADCKPGPQVCNGTQDWYRQ